MGRVVGGGGGRLRRLRVRVGGRVVGVAAVCGRRRIVVRHGFCFAGGGDGGVRVGGGGGDFGRLVTGGGGGVGG